MIRFRHRGDFDKSTKFLKKVQKPVTVRDLEKYGQAGVTALASATPTDTGKTANSWYYQVEQREGYVSISFCNSNIQNGVLVAVIVQYGHGTRNGGWVEGVDYINPAARPLFDQIANNVWREVTKA